jgi:putative transposase
LKEVEVGGKIGLVCRRYGISDATYYVWKSRFAGMDEPQLSRLRELEAENAKLKKMYAELAMGNEALRDVIAKKL